MFSKLVNSLHHKDLSAELQKTLEIHPNIFYTIVFIAYFLISGLKRIMVQSVPLNAVAVRGLVILQKRLNI